MPVRSPYLDELDDALATVPFDSGAMLLSELDGYLAGVLVCPDLIPPSEWLPGIWGEDEAAPLFDSVEELQGLTGLIMQHYNTISSKLQRGRYEPILEVDPDGEELLWGFWMEGFARAMLLRPNSWRAIIESDDPDAVLALTGLLTLISIDEEIVGALGEEPSAEGMADDPGKEPTGEREWEQVDEVLEDLAEGLNAEQVEDAIEDLSLEEVEDLMAELVEDAPERIPIWIEVLNAWRLKRDSGRLSPIRHGKIGRNDPCPCGSGRKFKKCCGRT